MWVLFNFVVFIKMDYKLKIFKAVALTQSFSRAAKQLYISQPAVSKCIQGLEEKYGKAFFDRKSNSIELTDEGRLFLEYAEKILQLYEEVDNEFAGHNLLSNEIKIGASTTIANYVLPKLLGEIQKTHPEIKVDLTIGNTFDIQQAVLKKELNLGIVEGENRNTRLHYSKFIKDELVLVSKYNQEEIETISIKELSGLPIVNRELGSGTREVIENALSEKDVLLSEFHAVLGSTESIKNYILYADAFAFLSVHSIEQELREQLMRIIDIEDLEIPRWFFFITRQGFQSKLNTKIQKLLIQTYNKTE